MGEKWRNRRIQFDCDNQSVVAIINSGTSKDSHIMKLVRELFLCAARMNFTIIAKHVPGKDNNIADSMSRFNMQVFRQLAPHAHLTPIMVPPAVLARGNYKLEQQTRTPMFEGIANSTRRTYDSAQRKFLEFCPWSKCIPDHLIKTLGRWFSNAYQLYIQTPHHIIETVPARIVCNNNHSNNNT